MKLKFAALAAAALTSAAVFASDPHKVLEEINVTRTETLAKAREAGESLDFAALNLELALMAEYALDGINLTGVPRADSYAWAQVCAQAGQSEAIPALLERFLLGSGTTTMLAGVPLLNGFKFVEAKRDDFTPSPEDAFNAAVLGIREAGGLGLTEKALSFSRLAVPYNDQSIVDRAGWSLAILGESLHTLLGVEGAFAYMDELTANLPETEDQMMSGQISSVRRMAGTAKVDILDGSGDRAGALAMLDELIANAEPRMAASLKSKKSQMTLVGSVAPTIKANEQIGDYEGLEAYAGKVVLVDFFAHWCGPCIRSFPDMIKLYDELHDQGVEILHVTRYYGYYGAERNLEPEKEFEKMKGFKAEHNLPWPIVFVDQEVFTQYGVSGIPHVALIDQDGNVEKIKIGYSEASFAEFRKHIEALLAKKKG
jgi:thiol-disulfide isomerase/thioredoxin